MTVEDTASNTDYLKEMQKVSLHWTIGTIWRKKTKTKIDINAIMKRTEEKYIVRKSERFMRISTPIDWKLGRWYRDAKQIQATYLQSCNMTI